MRRNDGVTLLAFLALMTVSVQATYAHGVTKCEGVKTDGVCMHAQTRSPKVATGEAVVVTGTLTNERADKLVLATTDPLGGFRIILRDSHGRMIEPNTSGRNLLKLVRRSKQQLAPGENTQQNIWLSSLYNFKKPGKYSITLTHNVPKSAGAGNETVKSNTSYVVITKK